MRLSHLGLLQAAHRGCVRRSRSDGQRHILTPDRPRLANLLGACLVGEGQLGPLLCWIPRWFGEPLVCFARVLHVWIDCAQGHLDNDVNLI